jgi:hypothetical protein
VGQRLGCRIRRAGCDGDWTGWSRGWRPWGHIGYKDALPDADQGRTTQAVRKLQLCYRDTECDANMEQRVPGLYGVEYPAGRRPAWDGRLGRRDSGYVEDRAGDQFLGNQAVGLDQSLDCSFVKLSEVFQRIPGLDQDREPPDWWRAAGRRRRLGSERIHRCERNRLRRGEDWQRAGFSGLQRGSF